MALSRNEVVINLLWVGLFEAWATRPRTFGNAVEYMRPATKELTSQAAQRITGRDHASME